MTDIWNERAEAYRVSQTHATGEDLDLVVAWCEPAEGVTVVVATVNGRPILSWSTESTPGVFTAR